MAKTLQGRIRAELPPIKGSRFIATAAPVASEAEAKALLAQVAAEMTDARHHCAAWRIAQPAIDRAVDAGEPSGSAGRPILAQLTGRELVDVCVVVTRYFGGVKLGVGGLVRAYGGAAARVLDEAEVVERVPTRTVVLEHSYEDADGVGRVLQEHGIEPTDAQYGATVRCRFELPTDPERGAAVRRALLDATGGRVEIPDEA